MFSFLFDREKLYENYRSEVYEQNLQSFEMFSVAGLIVALGVLLSRVISYDNKNLFFMSLVLVIYFTVIAACRKVIIGLLKRTNTSVAMYFLITPPILISLIMDTFLQGTEHNAVTFLMFFIIFPLFIMDRPMRNFLYITASGLLFLAVDMIYKTNQTFMVDFFHVIEFYVAGIITNLIILKLRFENLRHFVNARYHSEHNETTGFKNRYALQKEAKALSDSPLMLMMLKMDDYDFFYDMYGFEGAQNIMRKFADVISVVFGEENCFNSDGNEIIVLQKEIDEQLLNQKITECKEKMTAIAVDDKTFHLSFSCGYVYGTPTDSKTLMDMLTAADFMLYSARNDGRGQIAGHEYTNDENTFDWTASRSAANLDSLTGLLNIDFFKTNVQKQIDTIANTGRKLVFVYLNIENLKMFNDNFGYSGGDELLKYTARCLKEEFPDSTITRVAEDHFCIMCYKEQADQCLPMIIEKVDSFRSNSGIHLKAGVYTYEPDVPVYIAIDRAKLACDYTKSNAYCTIYYYNEKIEHKNKSKKYVLTHFEQALEEDWIHVYYQPIIRTSSGKICSCETLARWIDPERGIISPGDFIPILEENHLIGRFDLHFINKALSEFAERKDHYNFPISVNISRYDFEVGSLVEKITAMADKYELDHSRIYIEITESAFTDDVKFLKQQVDEFHKHGFSVWMDDFGSGYSSLNLLQDFDFDLIKLDMKFMNEFHNGNKNSIIISQINEMAKRLGIHTLTEGVENKEQLDFLYSIGCERIQGFFFSKPEPLDVIVQKIRDGIIPDGESTSEFSYYNRIGTVNIDVSDEIIADEHENMWLEHLPIVVLSHSNDQYTLVKQNDYFMHLQTFMDLDILKMLDEKNIKKYIAQNSYISLAMEKSRKTHDWVRLYNDVELNGKRISAIIRCLDSSDEHQENYLIAVDGIKQVA